MAARDDATTSRVAAATLTGDLDQVPPMVSALHVGGRRLHELAREGVEVERAPRRVHVASLRGRRRSARGATRFEVTCSSGTYVRSLVDDLGRALGGGAHLAALRRTRVGGFDPRRGDLASRPSARTVRSPSPRCARRARWSSTSASSRSPTTTSPTSSTAGAWRRRARASRGRSRCAAASGALVAVAARDADGVLSPEVVLHAGCRARSTARFDSPWRSSRRARTPTTRRRAR